MHDLDDFDRGTAAERGGGGRGVAALSLDGEGPERGTGGAFLFGFGFGFPGGELFDYEVRETHLLDLCV